MHDDLLLRHGVVSAAHLERLGWSRAHRETALRAGSIARIRNGWFAKPDATADVVAAVRAGGCVSCASALRLHGAWIPSSLDRAHIRRARSSDGIRRPHDCRPHGTAPPVAAAIDDVETAFRCLLRCGTEEDVVVVADSVLHLGLATHEELVAWSRGAPSRTRALLAEVDLAESGTESMTRFRLRGRNVRVRPQVWIDRRRVDLVVGDLLIIECDGGEHHASWTAQAADRERDRALTAAGYVVVRLTYRQVVHEWHDVERDLLAMIRRGVHRAPRRRKCR